MDIVLGVSMAPTAVRAVLVEGQNADGATVEEDAFEVPVANSSAISGAPEQVIAAILGTREGAAECGYRLTSTGVTWTESREAGVLRDALAIREIRSVMLVSPLLAAAVLTQTVGQAMDYEYTALLFVEPESATLAVVDSTDGSIVDLHRQRVHYAGHSAEAIAELAAMIAALDGLDSRPDGVFVVGCGVDIVPIKRQLDAMVSSPVSASEEPDMALARGAALASANAPLFASSTAALAYAQDPGTGEVNPSALAPTYLDVSANARGGGALAYSALADDEDDEGLRLHRPFLLAGSGLAAVFLIGIVALLISLAADVGPTVAQRTGPLSPSRNVFPTKQLPALSSAQAPAAAASGPSAPPAGPPQSAAPPPETITAPTPVVRQLPQQVATPAPVRKATRPREPVYVPPPAAEEAPPAAPPPLPPALPPPAVPPPAPALRLPPMVVYLHLPFVTVPIPINPPPPSPGP